MALRCRLWEFQSNHNLPGVGANYHDHVAAAVLMRTSNPTSYGISLKALPRGAVNVFEYLLMRKGPFASNVFESHAFVKTTSGLDRPDTQIVFQPARRNQSTFPLPLGHGFNISVVLLYPKSRGRIALSSPDPHAAPIIDPNILSASEDFDPLVRGLKLARRILAAPAFVPYKGTEFLPGPKVESDEALKTISALPLQPSFIRPEAAAWVLTKPQSSPPSSKCGASKVCGSPMRRSFRGLWAEIRMRPW